ncbi:helix-turn-helix transcriptional regulator [Variovorax sp. OV329]|uniref:helix-turn-helix domain-containing protein n=1 Tax=Variovorax sp. OV329 TaxID=1882825 RepID=UPI001113C4C0|nr:helix-turn-helix transcriptional regulator [Variovorax sp. OV329]
MREKGPATALAVERAADAKNLSIGRTSIGRYAGGAGNPTLAHLEALAEVFGVVPWKLLHPALGHDGARPTVSDQLEALASALMRLPPHVRREVGECFQQLAMTPEAALPRERLEELMAPTEAANWTGTGGR